MKLTKKEFLSVFLFLALIAIIIMDGALVLPNQVLIAADLEVQFDAIGLMVGTYTIVAGGSTLFFGYLTDLYERKKLLILAGIAWSIAALFHFLVITYWQLFTLRILAALATGVTTPVAFSYLADIISSDSRSKAFAFWGLITMLGGIAAGGIALAFNQIPYNEIDPDVKGVAANLAYIMNEYPNLLNTWRLPFFYLAFVALGFVVLNFLFTKEPKRAASEEVFEDISEENLQYSYKIQLEDLKYIFTRRSNFFLIMNLFDVVATGILTAFLFPYINIEMGIDFRDPEGLLRVVTLLAIAGPMAFIVGQFGLAHWADKKVQRGEITGRVKVATICGILNLPFLLAAFLMSPNIRTQTYFLGTLEVDYLASWVLWIIFASLLGVGLAFSFGIAPNWYSSLIDINFPEHRGTMIAMASFLDAIGRGLGAIFGGMLINITDSISATIFWATLIFGLLSTSFWIPLFYTSEEDFQEVQDTMEKRAERIKKKIEKQKETEKKSLEKK
ncbi:MAG: MFS transporter [Promethearchaeia archaeon]